MVIQLARNIWVLWSNVRSSFSPSRPPKPPPVKDEGGWGRLCGFLCQGDEPYTLCLAVGRGRRLTYTRLTGLLVSSWHHTMTISISLLLWVKTPTPGAGELRQSVLQLLFAVTGEKKSNLNKCCAVHSVPGINCSVVASFGRTTQKAVKASKKSQRTQRWGDEGRSKFNGLHELSRKPSADFSIFSGTFSF